jgi:hypothetical protein
MQLVNLEGILSFLVIVTRESRALCHGAKQPQKRTSGQLPLILVSRTILVHDLFARLCQGVPNCSVVTMLDRYVMGGP